MDNSELIAQFCAVTAADPELAEQYLAVADNNLESAITLFLESGGVSIESQQRNGGSGHDRNARSGSDSSNNNSNNNSSSNINIDEDDDAFVRRLQQEEYAKAGANETDSVRERIRPVTERLVDPGLESAYSNRFGGLGGLAGLGGLGSGGIMGGRNARNAPIGIFNQAMPPMFQGGSGSGSGFGRSGIHDDEDDEDEDDDDDMIISDDEDNAEIDRDRLLRQTLGTARLSAHQSRLAALFRPPFDLIQNIDLETANQQGQIEKKWILINIQNIVEFSCQQLNRDLWSNGDVKTAVKANFIFLQYSSDEDSGENYINYYPISNYPHIAILDPRTGERLKVWSEVPEAKAFIEELREFLSKFSLDPSHKNPIAKIRRNKTDVQHMTEEEQIEMAVRQSLGVKNESSGEEDDDFVSAYSDDMEEDFDDIEITDTKKVGAGAGAGAGASAIASGSSSAKTVKKEQEHIEIQDSEDEKGEQEEELSEEDIFASILPIEEEEPAADAKTTTRIQFRLGDGTRIIRRFRLNDSVKSIFAFLKKNVEVLSGRYFGLTSDRRKLIELVGESIESAKLQNSVVLVETLD